MGKTIVRGSVGFVVLCLALLVPRAAQASPLLSWTIAGPGITSATQMTATEWALAYNLNPSGFSTQTWTATATAPVSGDYQFAWNYSGFHSFFNVRAFLNTFNDASVLVNAGPANCCSAPSAGFAYSGIVTFSGVLASETLGFTFGGSHFDGTNVLSGTLDLNQIQPVPEPASLLLFGGGLAVVVCRFRRKTAA